MNENRLKNMITRVFRGKLVLIGDSAVGKTAMTQMFVSDGRDFPKNYTMTFGAEVFSKIIPIPGTNDAVELLIYDSSSFDLYNVLLDKFWRNPDLLMVVYDVSSRETFESVPNWMGISKLCKWSGEVDSPLAAVLFANKEDLENRRKSTNQEGIELADQFKIKFFSGSVKNNQGLEDAFRYLTDAFYQNCIKEQHDEDI